MNRTAFTVFLCFLSVSLFGQGADPLWDKDFAFGGSLDDKCIDVIETSDDQSVLAGGHTKSSNDDVTASSKGGYDFWVIKYDSVKGTIWQKSFGADTTDLFNTIVEVSDGYLLAGSSLSGQNGDKTSPNKGGLDFWVVKIDKSGNKQWDQSYGGSGDDSLTAAIKTAEGGFLLGGVTNSPAGGDKTEAGNGGKDYWIVKISPQGSKSWDKTFGGTNDDMLNDLFLGTKSTFLLGSSNSDIGGDKSENSKGKFDFWLLSVSNDGQDILYDKTFGGFEDDFGVAIAENVQGEGVYISGTTYSGLGGNKSKSLFGISDYWVLRIDSAGGKVWDLGVGGSSFEVATDMIATPEGAVVVGGYSRSDASGNKKSSNLGGIDYFIAKVDTSGNLYWDKTYGGSSNDTCQAIYLKCDRGILAGGHSGSDISGSRSKALKGQDDYWVFKLHVPSIPEFNVDNHCFGTAINFYDRSDIWPDSWEWDFGDPLSGNNTSTDQHPIHTFSGPGDFTVTMKIKEGCQKDTVIQKNVTVYENSVLGKVDLGDDYILCDGQTKQLENLKSPMPPDAKYFWSTGDTVETIVIDSTGKYALTVTSGNCSETDTIEFDDCPVIWFPNAFTPNNDEVNDTWRAKGIGIREYDLKVFNRWGELIFSTEEITEVWDGTYKNRKVQMDVYVFKCIYRGLGTHKFVKYGHITVVR